MKISYKKLWKLLIDREIKKKDLYETVSPALMAKLGRNENVTTDVLVRICTKLGCDVADIMEIVPDEGSLKKQTDLEVVPDDNGK